VATVTLTRPDLLNRLDSAVHEALIATFRDVAADPQVRAIVFASTGKVFSAGGDFEDILRGNADPAKRLAMIDEGRRLLTALLDIPVPVVCALHGDAIGAAATLVLCCDAIVSHASCRISDPHVQVGLIAGDGGCFAWPASVGLLRAKRHLLSGDPLSGQDAFTLGVVTDLAGSAEDVPAAAAALADRFAGLPPLAVQGTKRLLNGPLRAHLHGALEHGLAAELTTMATRDVREAVAAFRERRPPVYEGA
jgi:enoyl-CoA hydratase